MSGNIVRMGSAHPVVMASWRLFFACAVMALFSGGRLKEIFNLGRKDTLKVFLTGMVLAAHLIAWIAAVQHTKIANAVVFFCINPVITSIAAHYFYGEKITRGLTVSVFLGFAGIGLMGYDDLHMSFENAIGDAWALICSLLFTVYFLFGKDLRKRLGTTTYVVAIYGAAAITSFTVMFIMGLPAFSYDKSTWACFALLAIVPTAIGHTSFNAALKYIDASKISALTLTEPAMAGAVAWLVWGESLDSFDIAGYCFVSLSVLVLLWWKGKKD